MASIGEEVPNEGWCWSCGDLAIGPNEAPIVTRLRERAEAAEAALCRVAGRSMSGADWDRMTATHMGGNGMIHGGPREACVSEFCGSDDEDADRPLPRFPDPSRAPENACPVCWRRYPLWGLWPKCRNCPGRKDRRANGGKVETPTSLPPLGTFDPCPIPSSLPAPKPTVTVELDQSEAASVVDALISAADARREKSGRLHEVIADYLDDLAIRIHRERGVIEGHP